jgi:hypothetical protein
MCPFCISNLALLAVGTVSTGGATALVASKLRAKRRVREISRRFRQRLASREGSTKPQPTERASARQ